MFLWVLGRASERQFEVPRDSDMPGSQRVDCIVQSKVSSSTDRRDNDDAFRIAAAFVAFQSKFHFNRILRPSARGSFNQLSASGGQYCIVVCHLLGISDALKAFVVMQHIYHKRSFQRLRRFCRTCIEDNPPEHEA